MRMRVMTYGPAYANWASSQSFYAKVQLMKAATDQADHQATKPPAMDGVWQWLCYGLWEVAALSLAAVLGTTASYFFVAKIDNYGFGIALLAALITLVPLALAMDFYYRKRETTVKTGLTARIMLIHAVNVAGLGLLALVVGVVFLLQWWIDGSLDAPRTIALLCALTLLVLNAALFLRITDTKWALPLRRLFPASTVVISVVALALLLLGPIQHFSAAKPDLRIDRGLPTVDTAIQDYETEYSKLPPNLGALTTGSSESADLNADGIYLITHNLVTYTKGMVTPAAPGSTLGPTFYYQLCASYRYTSGTPAPGAAGETALTSGNHPSGSVCYHLNSNGT